MVTRFVFLASLGFAAGLTAYLLLANALLPGLAAQAPTPPALLQTPWLLHSWAGLGGAVVAILHFLVFRLLLHVSAVEFGRRRHPRIFKPQAGLRPLPVRSFR